MTYRDDAERKHEFSWTAKDMLVDMVWTLLSVSSRIIALVLFASYQLYWFWGLIITQIIVVIILSCIVIWRDGWGDLCEAIFYCIVTGVGSIFTMFFAGAADVRFYYYLLYWALTFVENTVVITLWYLWSEDFNFWYHDWAIFCVISVYFISLIVKIVHCYFYNGKSTDVVNWLYCECKPMSGD